MGCLFPQIKTGGLVVWTKGDIHFVYRGSNYQQNTKHSYYFVSDVQNMKHNVSTTLLEYGNFFKVLTNANGKADDALLQEKYQSICGQKDEEPVKRTLYEREVNRLLDRQIGSSICWLVLKPIRKIVSCQKRVLLNSSYTMHIVCHFYCLMVVCIWFFK